MSPVLYGCTICGNTIGGWEDPQSHSSDFWLCEFRGLYSGPDGLVLTGVGLYDEPQLGQFTAPPVSTARWDDEGYDHGNDEDAFGVMRQDAVNGRYGFVFHDSCFSLLELVYNPTPIRYQRLFDACSSVPIIQTVLDWGHNYGGFIRASQGYPWEAPDIEDDLEIDMARSNPSRPSEISKLLVRSPEIPPDDYRTRTVPTSHSISRDSLLKVPEEILLEIAKLLPTRDFLNARLASSAFWTIFWSQSFWLSRFNGSDERSWIFDCAKTSHIHNWRSLFRQTSNSRLSPGLRNYERITRLVAKLVPILQLQRMPFIRPLRDAAPLESLVWRQACADLQPTRSEAENQVRRIPFDNGCRPLYNAHINIPSKLSHLLFYFITVGTTNFLCGIEVGGDSDRENSFLGYKSMALKKYKFESRSELQGFNVAIGSRGIQAIRVCEVGCATSMWYGNAHNSPHSLKALSSGVTIAMKACFDGFKIVSLGVAEQPDSGLTSTPPPVLSLRESGIWFPEVPAKHIFLNEDTFPQLELHATHYNPLFWVSFGGTGGIYLEHLTKIKVTSKERIYGIQFEHDNTVEVPEIGLHPYHRPEYAEYARTKEFVIDGRSGERIESLVVYLEYNNHELALPVYHYGVLNCLEVYTNRGRSFLFGENAGKPELVKKRLVCKPGTVTTGFYASQRTHAGLTAIGLLSERIETE